jgi:alkylation response protein AidB-like acyl-CoA dehydrogenase
MDFSPISLDLDTQSFWNEVCEFLDQQVTPELIESEWETGDGYNRELHQALGRKGWAFPQVGPEEGGAGLDPLRTRILEQELVRHHAPMLTRDITALAAVAVRQWLAEPLRTAVLTHVAQGEVCFCLGYSEPEAGSDLASVRTRAERDGDEWVVNGQKVFTTGAQQSDYCFLLARTDPDAPKHKGLSMFLVPLAAPGVEIQRVDTLGGERTNIVFFDNVRVSDDYRLGPPGAGWQVLHGPLNLEHRLSEVGPLPVEEEEGEAGTRSADMSSRAVRVHETVLEAVVAWASTPQEDGTRPLDDPLVRERLAEAELGMALSKVTPGPHGRVMSAEAFIRNASDLLDLVGPYGLAARTEASSTAEGWVEYAHRFAQGLAIYGGTTEVFRSLIAQHFLGLSRGRPH